MTKKTNFCLLLVEKYNNLWEDFTIKLPTHRRLQTYMVRIYDYFTIDYE